MISQPTTIADSTRHTDPRLDYGRWLRIPGPTPLPPAVREALGREMLPHRAGELLEVIARVAANLKPFHGTEQPVFFWPGTGSAGWEIAIVNLLSPGDQVVVTVGGDFGVRWAKVAENLGLKVERVVVEWGQAVTPDLLEAGIARAGNVKAVLLTHNETSTGVTNPLPELAEVARKAGAYVLVDAVSSAGALPIEFDAWGLDWLVSGAQKAWMCPPGLAIAAVSERAVAAAEHAGFPRFFWDVRANAAALANGVTPSTAPESLLFGLDAALTMMVDEGVEQVWARHARLGELVRSRLTDLGLELLADPAYASNSITAFYPPERGSARAFKDRIAAASGVELAVGQGEYTDRILRFGHMGWVETPEIEATLEAIGAAIRT
jgi:aspartate aminotransferase-like enzyme